MNEKVIETLKFVQQSDKLSEEEKNVIISSLKDADKELAILTFKIERLEKVKHTTTVLLEQTIEELDAKRKSVEKQKRELEIEAALERVRSIAMGMRKPADMLDICQTIANELQILGVKEIRNVQTAIFCEKKGTYMNYEFYVKHDKRLITEVDYRLHPAQYEFAFKMLQGPDEFFTLSLNGQKLKDWYEYQKTTPQFADTFLESASSLNYYWYSMGPVALGLSTYEPLCDEQIVLFKRFRNVFELSYRRYLDIEKAEAQARESQIQLALERVRARTMAMQKSEELKNAAALLFQQVKELGVPAYSCGYNIWEKEEKEFTSWMSTQDGSEINAVYNIPLTEDANFIRYVESKQKEESFFVLELRGERMQEHYEYLKTIPAFKEYFDYAISVGFIPPETQIHHIANFSKGNLLFITLEPCPEYHDVFKRFAAVFEQTYTRFLDLQKAEAQAKEAKIEAALERIRSRSMAMQKSDELKDLIRLVNEQLVQLDIFVQHAGFIVDYKERDDMNIWLADPHEVPFQVTIPYFDCAHWNSFIDAKKTGKDFFANLLSFEEKNKFYEDLFQLIPGAPEEAKAYYLSCAGLAISTALLDNVGLYIENFSGVPYTTGENNILMRFGKVFQQAYTRFLDLQKAEAQARESQIQLALERVRARTMGMHNSSELGEVAVLLFEQVKTLGIETYASGFNIWSQDHAHLVSWMSNPTGSINPPFEMPVYSYEQHRLTFDAWKEHETFLEEDIKGEDLVRHYQFLRSFPLLNEAFNRSEAAGIETPARQVHNIAFFSKGYLLFITLEPQPNDREIFIRFAKVFEQTYTRFLDLRNAEAQARESQIETALEKVRSRTLAMQRSDELAETAAVLFQQLINLGIEPNRLYIGIAEASTNDIEFWITDEDGTKVSTMFKGDGSKNVSIKKMVDGWRAGQKSIVIDMAGKELEEYFHYLGEELHVPFKGGLSQKRRLQYIAFFSKGFIGMASPEEQHGEVLELLERFAYVFNLTFTRFNDLKLAEAHALQAQQDLVQIKEARRRAEEALAELKATQAQLIHSEKMASLGELTAGIAHEIQNPLNFVNNFSEVSGELLEEIKSELDRGDVDEAKAIVEDVKKNMQKIAHHGKRADGIVKSMLQHSRKGSGQKDLVDINSLVDEYLRMSYHGFRAKDKSFNAILETHYDPEVKSANIVGQDIGRVLLNLFNNAFYAVNERRKEEQNGFEPTIQVTTSRVNRAIEIRVKDNGTGIPGKVLEKIYQPFFTTKPTGEGTGLGLSLSYDIITKGHGGYMKVETAEGQGSEFFIQLPNLSSL